jgi:hypothetical protein
MIAPMPYVWMRTLSSGNIPAVLRLYTPNAVLVATYNEEPLMGTPLLRSYFQKFMGKRGLHGQIDSMITQQAGSVKIYSGLYTFFFKERGQQAVQARYTYVVVPTPQGQKILTHHSSEVPE